MVPLSYGLRSRKGDHPDVADKVDSYQAAFLVARPLDRRSQGGKQKHGFDQLAKAGTPHIALAAV